MAKFTSWHLEIDQILALLKSQKEGLSTSESEARLKLYGPNSLKPPSKGRGITLFLSQFKSPLMLLLIGAALLSLILGGHTDASIILTIVALTGLLGFFQERGALNALEKLLQLVENKVAVLRDGKEVEISVEKIVPGDVIFLRAGDLIPADSVLIDAKHLFVDEAMLTGESFPVEKTTQSSPANTPHLKRENCLCFGTVVASGFGSALVVSTGVDTEYAAIADRIRFRPPETAFEVGVRRFGQFLLQVTLVLVIVIFAVNIYLKKEIIESFLFSLALAVGLTPQLLPAIISVNLSHGARRMARKKVVVKRLPSIENFGQMNILCSDKTGTITIGALKWEGTLGVDGNPSSKGIFYGYLNSKFQAGYTNPLDQALINQTPPQEVDGWKKTDEIPYDFNRKRLSVVFEHQGAETLISKGAFQQVLEVCSQVELPDGTLAPLDSYRSQLKTYFEKRSSDGFRILALAYGLGSSEANLIFLGFIEFFDPIKPNVAQVIADLKRKGVSLKIITGDNPSVAGHVAALLGIHKTDLITGEELSHVSDAALLKVAKEKTIFAQIDPNQKERIILALRKSGSIVGYLGDGINDVSALHSADVGIAVDSGADTAKEAADIVLLEKDLSVLSVGIEEGRKTFINTLKYVYMATSANFGNMFSMAGVSLFLNFLPLLPKQVLLTNFFSDLPEMALATDTVDSETLGKPVRWDLPLIRRFMIVFGLLNSMADYLTFGVLLFWFKADPILFRSGWFVENVVSAALVVLAIRTRKVFYRSKPSKLLIASVALVTIGILFIPFTSAAQLFGFAPIPLAFYAPLFAIIMIYLLSVEIAKYFFFRNKITKMV